MSGSEIARRIEVKYRKGIDSRGEVIRKKILSLMEDGAIFKGRIDSVDLVDVYTVNANPGDAALQAIASMVTDPITQDRLIDDNFGRRDSDFADYAIEIGFKPGVTDNVGNTVRKGIEAKFGRKMGEGEGVHSSQVLLVRGDISSEAARQIGETLANPLIQNIRYKRGGEFQMEGFDAHVPRVVLDSAPRESVVDLLGMSDEMLRTIAKKGVIDPATGQHRGPLSLDADNASAMMVIRDYYRNKGRNPTDVEIECLAQTWSEHCCHTKFAASLDENTEDAVPKGLLKTYIKAATEKVHERLKADGRGDFLRSVFRDNSGIIKFDNRWAVTDKVETHNSPSALDPYGGALTGIVGVDRDAKGAGLGAMPFSHRFFFCLDNPKSRRQLFKRKAGDGTLEDRILSPRSIMDGVIAGVKDGGNKSGIPTPQGGAFFHESYTGKPLVYVGVTGLIPLESAGRPSEEKKAKPGDLVVMVGGRVGLDGIHGATFSSEAMDSGSPASAVQIGDPITQKKMSDAIVKEARDLGLYNSITDNGAGGLSCSVYEMARECGGADIDLDKVPLKYPGMRPDEILISESQERMTLAIPKGKLESFMDIMRKHDVEATVIGEFNDSGRATASFRGRRVLDINLDFLHNGLPQRHLDTTWTPELYVHDDPDFEEPDELTGTLHRMLKRLNICSKEFIYEQFDHEVQGGSVIKPMVGEGKVDSDATVTRPVLDSMRGVVMTQALLPRQSEIDTYDMAVGTIDTAIRNIIAAGGKLGSLALLDNFCWCSSDEPERLGQLKRAAQGCYDAGVFYGAPFISGKDSMFNTFKGFDEKGNPVKIDVLPTLMISGIGIVPDVNRCQTPDAKVAGDLVYVVGLTEDKLGGSEYYAMVGEEEQGRGKAYIGSNVPKVDKEANLNTYRAMEDAIERSLVASCASVGMGGLGVALAKVAIGGNLGLDIDVDRMYADGAADDVIRLDSLLFSESHGRFVVTVDPDIQDEFEDAMQGINMSFVGKVTSDGSFVVRHKDEEFVHTSVGSLAESYKSTLKGY
jgi:phosphoribosylformylglycinamidine synthase